MHPYHHHGKEEEKPLASTRCDRTASSMSKSSSKSSAGLFHHPVLKPRVITAAAVVAIATIATFGNLPNALPTL